MSVTIPRSTTLIAASPRYEVYNEEPHGFRVVRLSDSKEVTFYGDDQCERFRDHFDGDESDPDYDDDGNLRPGADHARDQDWAADQIGEWCEHEGEF